MAQPQTLLKRIAFVSTRIAGTDGVSLEIGKWASVIERHGIECVYIAGESDRSASRSVVIPEAHFHHPLIASINQRSFSDQQRSRELSHDIWHTSLLLRDRLVEAIRDLQVDALIVENAFTIPMNLPLGVALVQVVLEQGIGCLAHHHDFYWERERFLVGAVDDIVHYAFPPSLPQIQHVVINTLAAEEFSRRTGLSCRVIPNVMDFANPPPPADDYARTFRTGLGIEDGRWLILQPTRVVARKGIEHSIELIKRLGADRAQLVITHAAGDEGDAYPKRIREFAEFLGIKVLFADHCIGETRGTNDRGNRIYTIADAYSQADLVAYPSAYEGFGNAFLEAIYYRKPLLCNRYAIYRTDIDPLGFQVIEFDGFLTETIVREVEQVLANPEQRDRDCTHNYRLGRDFFSYETVDDELGSIILRPRNVTRLVARIKHGISPLVDTDEP